MSDQFVEALHNRLNAGGRTERGERAHDGDGTAPVSAWWAEFVDVVGQKVGAWNERQAPRPPINFTRQPDGSVHVWHRSAEATFTRTGDSVHVATRLGEQPARETIVSVRTGGDEPVVAILEGIELATPTAAAEHLLTPVLVETFTRP